MAKKLRKSVKDIVLYGVIVLLLIIVIALILAVYNLGEKEKPKETDVDIRPAIIFSEPKIIEKDETMVRVENSLRVVRDVKKNEDGSIRVTARLDGVENIDDEIVLNDFVEDIKFDKKIGNIDGNVMAKNGYLFPSKKILNVSSYGPGAPNEKMTKVNIVLLDINFDYSSENTGLYEFTFTPDTEVEKLIFDGGEVRTGKYILKLGREVFSLK